MERLVDKATRIVSLTVTEGGYGIDDQTGQFDATLPAVAHDLQPGAKPVSVFGLVVEALAQRRVHGTRPFTMVSCDNLQGNGQLARKAFASFARLRDPDLGDWIEREVSFPNSMVDRITPATTEADRTEIVRRSGYVTGGQSCASRSRDGRSKIDSPRADLILSLSACSWWRMSSRTS